MALYSSITVTRADDEKRTFGEKIKLCEKVSLGSAISSLNDAHEKTLPSLINILNASNNSEEKLFLRTKNGTLSLRPNVPGSCRVPQKL